VYEVMQQCWQEDPKKRPSFGKIHEILDALQQKYALTASGTLNHSNHSTANEQENSFYKLDIINMKIYNH
jgi:hypothetical protein